MGICKTYAAFTERVDNGISEHNGREIQTLHSVIVRYPCACLCVNIEIMNLLCFVFFHPIRTGKITDQVTYSTTHYPQICKCNMRENVHSQWRCIIITGSRWKLIFYGMFFHYLLISFPGEFQGKKKYPIQNGIFYFGVPHHKCTVIMNIECHESYFCDTGLLPR